MKPAVIAKMCGTKIKYPTAKDAARAIEYHRVTWKVPMRDYSCPICGRWHLARKQMSDKLSDHAEKMVE